MRHPTSVLLYQYWIRLWASEGMPRRLAVEPFALGAAIVDVFLVDLDPAAAGTFRFCGSAVGMRFGRDLAGECLLRLWRGDDRAAFAKQLSAMRREPLGCLASAVGETAAGGAVILEWILLPLRGGGFNDRAIGAVARIGGHDGRHLPGARVAAQSLRSIRSLRPPRGGGNAGKQAASSERPGDSGGRPPRERPNLVLVQGGK
ncbi:PAS domain-containing protein [Propylenella binzhouense]|nr:PAS domain-containing protein [Propylenella binzhouense]